jgi:hypothetical protein
MNFKYPLQKICAVPRNLLESANLGIIDFEQNNNYEFKLEDWQRLDSYFNPKNKEIADIVGQDILDYLLQFFPDDILFGWSISKLPGGGEVVDHCDRMLFHRFAKRIIIVTSNTEDVLNWHWHSDRKTKIPYVLEYGNVYRLNTAYTHGLKNHSGKDRRGFYLDMMPSRLWEKFKEHPDLLKVIVKTATENRYVFQ